MNLINIEINDGFFNEEEVEKLKILFKTENNDQFVTAIQDITYAALTEYKEMLLGKGLSTRADEIKQHRLYLLVKHFFHGVIPNESEVSSVFQLTESESRALIRKDKI